MKNGIFNQKRKTARKKVNPLSLLISQVYVKSFLLICSTIQLTGFNMKKKKNRKHES